MTRIKALWSICNTWINDGGCRHLLIEKDFSENLRAYLLIIRGYRARAIATYIYIISPQMRPQQRLSWFQDQALELIDPHESEPEEIVYSNLEYL